MTCEDVKQQLVERLYGELPTEGRDSMESHLQGCSICRAQWESLGAAHRLLEIARGDECATPEVDAASVLRSIAARADRGRRRWRSAAVLLSVAAACVVLAAVLGLRVELYDTHVVLGWGERMVQPHPADRPKTDSESVADAASNAVAAALHNDEILKGIARDLADLKHELEQHALRTVQVDDLAQLTARQVLQTDARSTDNAAQLERRLASLQSQLTSGLKRVHELQEQRYKRLLWYVTRTETEPLAETAGE